LFGGDETVERRFLRGKGYLFTGAPQEDSHEANALNEVLVPLVTVMNMNKEELN